VVNLSSVYRDKIGLFGNYAHRFRGRAMHAPTNVMEMLAISEKSAPSVTPLWRRDTSPVTSDGGGFKLGVDSKMRPPPFLNGGGFKMAGGHTFCRMSAVDI